MASAFSNDTLKRHGARRIPIRLLLAACLSLVALPAMGQEGLDSLIRELVQTAPGRRIQAAKRLSDMGTRASRATPALIAVLDDPLVDVRVSAATALAYVQTDSARAIEALAPLLLEGNEHVRYAAEWSIAHIAGRLPSTADDGQRRRWLGLLEKSLETFNQTETQPRNRLILQLAIQRLGMESSSKPIPFAPSATIQDQADPLELARSLYGSNDCWLRLQFMHRIADGGKYPDAVRQFVLRFEAKESDPVLLRHALRLWGETGRRNLESLAEAMEDPSRLEDEDLGLIEHLRPESLPLVQRWMRWTKDRTVPTPVRVATLKALASSQDHRALVVPHLTECLQDQDQAIVLGTVEALSRLGTIARAAEAPLVTHLRRSPDPSLQPLALEALKAIAPDSPLAAGLVAERLRLVDRQDFMLLDWIEACSHYPSHSVATAPWLVEHLRDASSDIRLECAKALAKIAPRTELVIDGLVARIVDAQEEIRVKNAAARALERIGPPSADRLMAAMPPGDPDSLESVLRGLAILGEKSGGSLELSLKSLRNEGLPPTLRAAAADALGAHGPQAMTALEPSLKLVTSGEAELLRAAALIAAARIDPRATKDLAVESLEDSSRLVQASAAFACHLCGESEMAFQRLCDLLDGSPADDVIVRTMQDMGTVVYPLATDVACDPVENATQRLACFRLACQAPRPDWRRLLLQMDDIEMGDQLAMALEGFWFESVYEQEEKEAPVIAAILSHMEQLSVKGRARLAGLFAPDGLGAAGDEDSWSGLIITQPESAALLASSSPHSSVEVAPVEVELPATSAPGGRTPATVPKPPLKKAKKSREPETQAAQSREVTVFYGTNRGRDPRQGPLREVTLGVLVLTATSVVMLLVCTAGFSYNRKPVFAFMSLLAVAVIGPTGWYGSHRLSQLSWQTSVAYTTEYADRIEFGKCQVSIPPNHQPGVLETPAFLKMEVEYDPERHVVLTGVRNLSQDAFFEGLEELQADKGRNLLVFIHGYNVSFEDAARRTAQMAFDLRFEGAPVFYSWPSQANWYGYGTDQDSIQLSVKHIKRFLTALAERSHAQTINLVAHSMGNVGLTQALKEMDDSVGEPLFNQVILAAPDIDATVFKERIAPFIVSKARRMTLYTSRSDLALIASRYFNQGPRLGDSGPAVVVYDGIETIDATAVDCSLLGHSYYGSNVSVLADVANLLRNQPIDQRPYLRRVDSGASPYWSFDPTLLSDTSPPREIRLLK
jgi:esterase/lipase superfamily enzyme/HEAT repeat protein